MASPPHQEPNARARRDAQQGVSLLEVLLAMVLLSVGLAAVAGVFGATARTSDRSREMTRSTRFLEQVMASIEAQSYDAVLAMNGNTFRDGKDDASSLYTAKLSTTVAGVGLAQVAVVLTDLRTGREQARIGTYRSMR